MVVRLCRPVGGVGADGAVQGKHLTRGRACECRPYVDGGGISSDASPNLHDNEGEVLSLHLFLFASNIVNLILLPPKPQISGCFIITYLSDAQRHTKGAHVSAPYL